MRTLQITVEPPEELSAHVFIVSYNDTKLTQDQIVAHVLRARMPDLNVRAQIRVQEVER